MRSRDRDSLLRIEHFTERDRIGEVFYFQISRFREFRIPIYLLFWCEVRFRDDRLRVDNEIGIVREILTFVSDKNLESLASKSIEKWGICSI